MYLVFFFSIESDRCVNLPHASLNTFDISALAAEPGDACSDLQASRPSVMLKRHQGGGNYFNKKNKRLPYKGELTEPTL